MLQVVASATGVFQAHAYKYANHVRRGKKFDLYIILYYDVPLIFTCLKHYPVLGNRHHNNIMDTYLPNTNIADGRYYC